MFDYLRSLDPHIAAGVLAQAALRLDARVSFPDPGHQLIDNQAAIERDVLNELRNDLGLAAEDYSPDAIDKLTDALDQQAAIIGHFSSDPSSDRLSEAGLLASDAYEIYFDPSLSKNYGAARWGTEQRLATLTIRKPHREQVLATRKDDEELPRATIFGRLYRHKFPARSFWMLVVGARAGNVLEVSQIWRVYPNEIDLSRSETLLDVLKAFSDQFGQAITLSGVRAKFFMRTEAASLPRSGTVEVQVRHGETVVVSLFYEKDKKGSYVFLVVPVNLTRYLKAVEYWRGWDRSIFNDLDEPDLLLRAANTQTTSA